MRAFLTLIILLNLTSCSFSIKLGEDSKESPCKTEAVKQTKSAKASEDDDDVYPIVIDPNSGNGTGVYGDY